MKEKEDSPDFKFGNISCLKKHQVLEIVESILDCFAERVVFFNSDICQWYQAGSFCGFQ